MVSKTDEIIHKTTPSLEGLFACADIIEGVVVTEEWLGIVKEESNTGEYPQVEYEQVLVGYGRQRIIKEDN